MARRNEEKLIAKHKGKQSVISRYKTVSGKIPSTVREDAAKILEARNRSERALQDLNDAKRLRDNDAHIVWHNAAATLNSAKDARTELAVEKAALEDSLRHGNHFEGWVIDTPDGPRRLTNAMIHQHMGENGVNRVSFLSTAHNYLEDDRGGRGTMLNRGDKPGKSTTGTSLTNGTWDSTARGIAKQVARGTHRVETARGFDEMIRSTALARHMTPEAAQEYIERYNHDHPGIQLKAVNERAKELSPEQTERVNELQDDGKGESAYAKSLLDNRLVRPSDPHDPNARVAVIPKAVIDRERAHLTVEGRRNPLEAVNRHFRNTVLPFSTKWIAGNTFEAALRLALKRAGIGDYRFAHKLLNGMDDEEREAALSHIGGGLNVGFAQRANLEALTRKSGEADAIAQSQVIRRNWMGIVDAYTHLRNGIFHFNRAIESRAEVAAFGAHAKAQLHEFAGSWENAVKHQEDYMQQLRDHLATPQGAEAAAKAVHDTLGKYAGFSPSVKTFINSVAPFGPWYLNSMKFVAYTLPHDHPYVQAALLADRAHDQHLVDPSQPF
ncbi:MAG TPA: hypothetical protein VMF89_03930, partial [Polyangiales bacterium]|nr:hypothetical protein [Polyangiales bacterium]